MQRSHTHVSVLCLAWINEELRKEMARREEALTPEPNVVSRFKTMLAAGVIGLYLTVAQLLY